MWSADVSWSAGHATGSIAIINNGPLKGQPCRMPDLTSMPHGLPFAVLTDDVVPTRLVLFDVIPPLHRCLLLLCLARRGGSLRTHWTRPATQRTFHLVRCGLSRILCLECERVQMPRPLAGRNPFWHGLSALFVDSRSVRRPAICALRIVCKSYDRAKSASNLLGPSCHLSCNSAP